MGIVVRRLECLSVTCAGIAGIAFHDGSGFPRFFPFFLTFSGGPFLACSEDQVIVCLGYGCKWLVSNARGRAKIIASLLQCPLCVRGRMGESVYA